MRNTVAAWEAWTDLALFWRAEGQPLTRDLAAEELRQLSQRAVTVLADEYLRVLDAS